MTLPKRCSVPSTIAIDGPAASGKSTLGKNLADHLGYLFFDTGVMYRAVTWVAQQRGVPLQDEAQVTALAEETDIDIQPPSQADGRNCDILADGQDVTWLIRRPEVDANVSLVSAYAGVRQALTAQQRRIGLRGQVVMVGRDIGTVVLPEAEVKIYLDASAEERAQRRYQELVQRGEPASYEHILNAMRKRDQIDSTRAVAPLRPAQDATILDSDHLDATEVLQRALQIIRVANNSPFALPGTTENSARRGGRRPPVPSMRATPYTVPLHNRILRFIFRPFFRGLFHILSNVQISGRENVPKSGAYLVAINHVSLYEAPFILAFWPTAPEAAGAIEIWSRPGQNILVRLYGGIPVHRGQYDRQLLDTLLRVLRSGRPLVIAPEGGRSHTLGMRRALPGAAYVIDLAQVPVIPVGFTGATDNFLEQALRGKRPKIEMRIGQPVRLPLIQGKGEARRLARQYNADFIMTQIAALLPPEYRGVYSEGIPNESVTAQAAQ